MAGNSNSGRRPTPTALKVVTGNPGKRPLPENEPTPPPLASLEPPSHLSDGASAQWRKTAPILAQMRVLTKADADALAVYCETVAAWIDAKDQVAKSGTLVRDGKRIAVNPLVKLSRNLGADMIRMAGEFGMTPSSRTRLSVQPELPVGGVDGPASDASVAAQLFSA